MYNYIVTKPVNHDKKISLDDIYFDLVTVDDIHRAPNISGTKTYKVDYSALYYSKLFAYSSKHTNMYYGLMKFGETYRGYLEELNNPLCNYEAQVDSIKQARHEFNIGSLEVDGDKEAAINKRAAEILEDKGYEWLDLYRTFWIPKKSIDKRTGRNKLRRIDAPIPNFSSVLRELASIIEEGMGYNTYHTAAYAYVPNRSTFDSIKKHQSNHSRWMLKLDFSDFFGSTTLDFLMNQLSQIYPFSKWMMNEERKEKLTDVFSLCFLNGGLPQGTPISPLLTNLMMIPIDYELTKGFNQKAEEITTFEKRDDDERKHRLVYTRYADDMLISSRNGFRYNNVVKYIKEVLASFDAPFSLNDEKTRYSSSAGANWNLGLMLNKDNEITVGHRRKKQMNAMICNFILDSINGKDNYDKHDVEEIMGNISYLRSIEPDYTEKMINKYNSKYNTSVMGLLKSYM